MPTTAFEAAPAASYRWLFERWQTMVTIRRSEEIIARMVETGEARCPCHLSIGQEAIAAGVSAALETGDTVWGGHRSHGHYLAKGGSAEQMFAEILGKASGCSGGRGGSMHLADPSMGILGTVPIVGGTVPLAAGAALAAKMQRSQRVAVAYFGDGTAEEGHVHESLNLASLYRLPVLFICENNLYASHMHWSERRIADNLDRIGEFHSIPGCRVDGNDVTGVYENAREAVARARAGDGPTFLECRTFRWRGHVGASYDTDVGVKRRGELEAWLANDPIRRVAQRLEQLGVKRLAEKDIEISHHLQHALTRAREAATPDASRVHQHVWAEAACAR